MTIARIAPPSTVTTGRAKTVSTKNHETLLFYVALDYSNQSERRGKRYTQQRRPDQRPNNQAPSAENLFRVSFCIIEGNFVTHADFSLPANSPTRVSSRPEATNPTSRLIMRDKITDSNGKTTSGSAVTNGATTILLCRLCQPCRASVHAVTIDEIRPIEAYSRRDPLRTDGTSKRMTRTRRASSRTRYALRACLTSDWYVSDVQFRR